MAPMKVVTCNNCGTKNRVDLEQASAQIAKCGKCGTPLQPGKAASLEEGKPMVLTDSTFQSAIRESDRPILVDAWAPWCGPCRMVAPIMEQLAAEANGRYRIAKLNVDETRAPLLSFKYKASRRCWFSRMGIW